VLQTGATTRNAPTSAVRCPNCGCSGHLYIARSMLLPPLARRRNSGTPTRAQSWTSARVARRRSTPMPGSGSGASGFHLLSQTRRDRENSACIHSFAGAHQHDRSRHPGRLEQVQAGRRTERRRAACPGAGDDAARPQAR
jgi:hypothetical protein